MQPPPVYQQPPNYQQQQRSGGHVEKTAEEKRKENTKRGCLGLVGIVVLAGIGILVLCDGLGPSTAPAPVTEAPVAYHVETKEDDSYALAKRFTWHVVLEEPATSEELKAVAENAVERAKGEVKFNAIMIFMYDYAEFIGYGYTLGKATFAPGGDWSQAASVDAGDYDKMSFSWDLKEKDWSKQLTPQEAEVWAAWQEAIAKVWASYTEAELADPETMPDEKKITNQIAEEFGMSPEEVDAVLLKQMFWMMSDE